MSLTNEISQKKIAEVEKPTNPNLKNLVIPAGLNPAPAAPQPPQGNPLPQPPLPGPKPPGE